jgi:hypothetical protein
MLHGGSTRGAGRLPEQGWYRTIVLVVLFTAGAVAESMHLPSLRNPAVWGHLRVGVWILENKSFPRTGLFSQSANLPWQDLSWGYDALAGAMYKILEVRAVPALAMVFGVVAAVVVYLLAGGRPGNLLGAATSAGVGVYTLSTLGPNANGASVIFFGLELLVLLNWRRGRESRATFMLPVIFLIWANLDVGFIFGILVFALFVVSLWVRQLANISETPAAKGRTAAAVLLACVAISGITPYGYSSYAAFWQMERSAANLNIPGYAAMGFRQALDYVVLLLGMSAFLAMGLRRSRDIFLVALLSGTAMLAFHSQRETWLLIVSSVAVIGHGFRGSKETADGKTVWKIGRPSIVIAGITVAIAASAFVLLIPRDPKLLMARVSETFPVKACDYIRSAHLPKPLFNADEWGGFLTWYLPEYPVAIDGRRGLYPEEMESDYFEVMKVDVPYQTYPAMRDARTILLEKTNVVAGGLKNVPGFSVAYEDDVAVVLVQGAKE